MRTITLELLRHGTAHNQLLSPLTPYLALCENHAAVTLHVPFEHNQFLFRLSSLTYKLKDESRTFQLNDTAKILGEILSQIPGLTAESNKGDHKEELNGEPLTHLRLIISASELALLPFEIALSPNGLPGAGQHLLLQPQMPICLTREIRRVPGEQVRWPKTPKILFIAAAPPGVGTIPLESHLLALRRLISPWVYYYDKGDSEKRRQRVGEHLHFLSAASIESIEDACASGNYTHIHILAHGVEVKENYDTRFALALHDARDPAKTDYIRGGRLATALRASQRPNSHGLSMPAVVTLTSCDSGNIGSVAGAGASIAHSLHEAGIPMVVAGQFPLSFEGSVRLIECLYEGLLWGTDPRPLLFDLRRRLYAQFQENHDWASLTAYVSLPSDFDKQLPGVQIDRAMHSINAAINHADEATRKLSKRFATSHPSGQVQPSNEEKKALVESARHKIEEAKRRLERLLTSIPAESAHIYGLLASTEKRQAEVLYTAATSGLLDDDVRNRYEKDYKELLRKARDHYWDSFLTERSDSWAVVQYLSLTLTMQKSQHFQKSASLPDEKESQDAQGNERQEKNPDALWSLAHLLSLYDLNNKKPNVRVWAHGNLVELYLLSLVITPSTGVLKPNEAERRALQYADALVDIAGRDSFEVYSTRRQILRYIDWFGEISNFGPSVRALAEKIFQRFPEEAEDRWK
jgi:hypothetical protein